MKGCGCSIVGIVLGLIVSVWLLFHISDIWGFLNSIAGMFKF